MSYHFYTEHEQEIAQQFLKSKYIIKPAEDMEVLHAIRKKVARVAAEAIHHPLAKTLSGTAYHETEVDFFLNHFHQVMSVNELNEIRLKIIAEMNRESWFRLAYFKAGRQTMMVLAGNELAMQKKINLSIQFPHDDSSLLPVHADAWSGDSPFEVVMWIPLVDCYATKSMFIANAAMDEEMQADFSQFKGKSSEDLYQTIEKEVEFLSVPFGSILFFSQNVMHGNRINREKETRWSMNCRFKSILTPYRSKKMGEFFEPITLRPATRLGLKYNLPENAHD